MYQGQRPPRRKAAKQALATRENQGNLAPAKNGGRFLSGVSQDSLLRMLFYAPATEAVGAGGAKRPR